ncbi:MAG TPA: photosynthetic reaction center cytochrome c subunit family protein [Bryobacteraceae bacterium]|nr:photosynthetic reaction center cytochrome c subunit family protein [Bryobacteraceae bacterium]
MMRSIAVLTFTSATILSAQVPGLSGVWKADLQKSQLSGPQPTNYMVLIEQKNAVFNRRTKEEAPEIIETTQIWGQRGEQRSVLTVFNNGKPTVQAFQGVPTRLIASAKGPSLAISGQVAGRPNTFTRTYTLSPDGKTLVVDIVNIREEEQSASRVVLVRQPDKAAESFRKPEETAGVHFKNVKTASFKDLPESEFINQMRYIAWSLNRDCEFCHVAHKFDSDDKREKRTARKMIDMVAAINQNHFDGHPEVRCFTCHEGHAHPLSRPQTASEVIKEKEAIDKANAEEKAGAAPPHPPTAR